MALTFPRAMPTTRVGPFELELDRIDLASPEVGGGGGGVSIGTPRWYLVAELGPGLTEAQSAEWQAFRNSLNGQANQLYGRHLTREYPLNYSRGWAGLVRAGTAEPFPDDGDATAWAVDGARRALTLQGMPDAFKLRPGDLVGFKAGVTKRTFVQVLEVAVASGAGNLVTDINPALPAYVTAAGGWTAYLRKATCIMRQDVEQTKFGKMDQTRVVPGTFVARQEHVW